MSVYEGDYVADDTYNSEDTASTQSGDLDYDLNIDVKLPDNTTQRTTIPANTPWGDLRAQLCSKFKLSPTSHVVDFISSSTATHKRRASLAVGKMNITMIRIKKKEKVKHAAPPPPVPTVNVDGSVRLIVRLPQSRQSILRVNPDAPLSNIFNNISNKLKLSEDSKKQVEFLHPAHHETKLKPNFSLNDYNLREVFLAEKKAPPTPSRGKKKAPPPPRPPPPAVSSRNKSSSSSVNPPSPVKEHVEPIYAQVRKQPKPTPVKRRSAPVPPQVTSSESTNENEEKRSVEFHNKEPTGKVPVKAPRKHISLSEVFPEESSHDSRENDASHVDSKRILSLDDESNPYATIDDAKAPVLDEVDGASEVFESNETVDDRQISDGFGLVSAPEIPERSEFLDDEESGGEDGNVLDSIDEVLDSDEEKDVIAEVDAIHSIEEVLEDFDDVKNQSSGHVSDDDTTQNPIAPEVVKEKIDEIVSEAISEDIGVTVLDDKDDVVEDRDETNRTTENQNGVEASSKTVDSSSRIPEVYPHSNPNTLENIELPSLDASDSSTSSAPELKREKIHIPTLPSTQIKKPEPSTKSETVKSVPLPNSKNNTDQVERNKENQDFDLHIAESFNISLKTIDQQQKAPEVKKSEKTIDHQTQPLPFKVNGKAHVPHNKKEVKPEMTESETEKEIEKIHKQIQMMRNRNSVKQKEANANVKTWQTGTFKFVPTTTRRLSHDDYDIEPVTGIQLSNSGEIKTLQVAQEKKASTPSVQTDAVKTKSTLPSYYKKLLGVQAFAAKETK